MAQEYKVRPREAALETIVAYIAAQNLQPGDRLPAEREICQMWSLNRSTLRSALSRLERDGVLDIGRGRVSLLRGRNSGEIFKISSLSRRRAAARAFGWRTGFSPFRR